jgi:Zn-dependent peptidase ImmA (M78 family)
MTITKEQLKKKILQLTDDRYKVDIIGLAQDLGLKVFLAEDGKNEFNAEIVHSADTDQFKILVNAYHPYTRRRFSVAHEIAHFILHRDQIIADKKIGRSPKDDSNRRIEQEADELAAEILMPEVLVQRYMKEIGVDKSTPMDANAIKQIAETFAVSPAMATIRLNNLGYHVTLAYVA